jgi:hypothetical protein
MELSLLDSGMHQESSFSLDQRDQHRAQGMAGGSMEGMLLEKKFFRTRRMQAMPK